MGKQLIPPEPSDVQEVALREALEERYLNYALSTIMHRALPDARDGLKPVHRRILYGMRLLRLDPGVAFKKSAKIVGDVMGNFHPHGDQAIYDALVRLAQDFNSRYPLIDGQGNFGNIDGDNPAAMRYTEARLTEVARLLLEGIDEDAVDFRATYDGSGDEPVVLPGAFPNMLANGAQGIAVGMATAIPPHNAAELCDAALFLIDNPNARSKTLLKYVPGPDFPTGGLIVDPRETIAEAYVTGRGSFRVRARWTTEDTGRGTYSIVVTQIPWLVQKSRLVERIAELLNDKKLPLVADVRDESADDVRLVIEPRSRTVDPEILMESLFKLTELESRIPLNMNVLVKGKIPKVVGLAEALRAWLDHRREVLLRRTNFRVKQIEARLEVLGGYLIAYLNLDEVIRIIRNEDEPKPVLIKTFKLTDVQADAILNMRLRNLRKLEEMEIKREDKDLRAERKELQALLRSEKEQWKKVADEIKKVRETFGPKTPLGKRRTGFAEAPEHDEAAIEEAMVVREPITVVVSEKGWIRALRGHVTDLSGVAFKSDDSLKFAFPAETTSKIMIFATNGRFYTIEGSKLPGGRGHGEPVRLFIDLDQAGDLVAAFVLVGGRKFLVVSHQGKGFVVAEDECVANTRKGKQVLNVKMPDEARAMAPVEGELVVAIGENRKMVIFGLDQLPEMARGSGVRLQRYKDGGLSDAKTFKAGDGLTWTDTAGRAFSLTIKELADWRGNRADAGRIAPKGFPRTNKFNGGAPKGE
ncbi:MAG TPA: DNA topoisomerase IV subunit A [Xanthobacteraceae bacterium]|nr:DNA topoisomerase IV subunit A [Xanthobacteraceae bacterium]